MKNFISILLVILLIIGVTSCSPSNKSEIEEPQQNTLDIEDSESDDNTIKFQSEEIDFSNVTYQLSETTRIEKLDKAIIKALDYDKETDGAVRYYYNRVDLNNDQIPEVFVYLIGPYVSGTGGSTALIFQEDKDEYKLFSKFTLVNNPIIVSENQSNGWNDLIMYVAGGGIEPFYSEIKFDGSKYPSNPSVQPEVVAGVIVKGEAIIADDTLKKPGIELD